MRYVVFDRGDGARVTNDHDSESGQQQGFDQYPCPVARPGLDQLRILNKLADGVQHYLAAGGAVRFIVNDTTQHPVRFRDVLAKHVADTGLEHPFGSRTEYVQVADDDLRAVALAVYLRAAQQQRAYGGRVSVH